MEDLLNKFKGFLGIDEVEDYDDEEYMYDQEDDAEDFAVSASKSSDFEVSTATTKSGRLFGNRFNSSPVSFRERESKKESRRDSGENTKEEARKMADVGSSGLRVVLCKPTEFDNCQGICSHLRAQMTIVLNLEYVANAADRKRIFDFVSGCCYALDGNIQKVADLIYVIAPYNVDVFAEVGEEGKAASESYDYDSIF
jgi:cell division inhibitor SepF